MRSPFPRSPLVRKYVVVLLVLVGGVLMASSLVELYFVYRETQRAIVRVERAKAVAAAGRIEQFLKEVELQVRETTRTASDDPDASQTGPARLGFRQGLGAALVEQRELDFLRVLRNVPAVTALRHADLAGREQLRVSRLDPDVLGSGADLSSAPEFVAARGGKTYWSPVYLKNEWEPYATLAVPAGKYAIEVTTAEVNLAAVVRIVSQIEAGPGGYAYVVDARDHLVAHPDHRVLQTRRDLSAAVQVKAGRAEERAAAGGEPIAHVAEGLSGGRVLAAHAAIGNLGWMVFVERPAADAYAPLRAPIARSAVIFVLGLGLSVLASVLLARRMVAPIRTLQEGAARIGAGELGHRITLRTGDELEALGDELNRSAAQLAESYANLEQKVEARTRELATANAGLTEALQELQALGEVSRALSSTLDLETVLSTIVTRASELAHTDSCTVYEYDEGTEQLLLRATHDLDEAVVAVAKRSPIRRGEGVAGRLALTREPIEIPDMAEAGAYTGPLRDVLLRTGTRALLGVPLLHEDRLVGALTVNRKTPGAFAPEIVALLRTFASQSALAIQNARLYREIAEKSRELEAASRHKSEFLANMSHELRTPLNAILGFSEVLHEGMFGEVNEKQAEYLRDILESGRHLLSLINDILDLSKIEAGRMELDSADFDLPSAIENALTLVRERAGRRGIQLGHATDRALGVVHADERKLKQVLLNLLSNALKFTPEGGRVDVRAVSRGDHAEISVADTGVGIAPEDQETIFEEFRQVGASEKKVEGTGLGLALSRRFIELHGGRMWVTSEVGKGSVFSFTLPLRQ
ncbi:MAG TPA: ATP-binding protein [Methylomirabilota bacterium]|nr:ATP-binding protein [Methylomirabilota bacterium]